MSIIIISVQYCTGDLLLKKCLPSSGHLRTQKVLSTKEILRNYVENNDLAKDELIGGQKFDYNWHLTEKFGVL